MKWTLGAAVVMFIAVTAVHGKYKMVMDGCTESFVHMKCPGSDILSVMDLRVEINNSSHSKCVQQLPPKSVAVPHEMLHLCDPKKSHCVWEEDICEHVHECVFYVSPHMIDGKEEPTIDSELIIEYECKAGGGRMAGFAVLICFTIIGGAAMIFVAAVLVWKDCQTENYDHFTNEPVGNTAPAVTMQTVSNPEHIAVQLQTAGASAGAATVSA